VRGFAALWVVLYHLRPLFLLAFPNQVLLNRFVHAGYLGVDLFAFLSGFIIAYTYCDRLQGGSLVAIRRYLWLRFVRTYPLHLFILLLFVAMFVYERGFSSLPILRFDSTLWRQVFMLNGWGFEDRWGWNLPSWSLSAEWFCYLLFPLAAPLLVRVKKGSIALLLSAVALAGTIGGMHAVGRPGFHAQLDFALLRIGGEFLTGACLYLVYRSGVLRRLPTGWIGLVAIVAMLAAPVVYDRVWLGIVGSAVFILCLTQDKRPLSFLFGNPLAVYLGEISYSIYLLHWLFVGNLTLIGFEQLTPLSAIGGVLALTLIGAVLCYHGVERNGRKYLRHLVPGP
jgi:peptidoglycan/LPS O-acetylase OafA/YrhL